MNLYESYGLDKTVRVTVKNEVTHGLVVLHKAANIKCGAILGERRDRATGEEYVVVCKRPAHHATKKGEKRHKYVDIRIVAAPSRVSHEHRFAPSGIPAGVDQSITLPHDCANHVSL